MHDSHHSHHGRRRVIAERQDRHGQVHVTRGLGFTGSVLDDIASRTDWFKYQSLTLQDRNGDVRITFRTKDFTVQDAIAYRNLHHPHLKVVWWRGESAKAPGVTRIF